MDQAGQAIVATAATAQNLVREPQRSLCAQLSAATDTMTGLRFACCPADTPPSALTAVSLLFIEVGGDVADRIFAYRASLAVLPVCYSFATMALGPTLPHPTTFQVHGRRAATAASLFCRFASVLLLGDGDLGPDSSSSHHFPGSRATREKSLISSVSLIQISRCWTRARVVTPSANAHKTFPRLEWREINMCYLRREFEARKALSFLFPSSVTWSFA